MSGDGTFGGFGHDFAEEAMTNDDLQQQAREAALLSTPLSTPYAEDQCWYDNDALRDEFVAGFLAAAEPRETELIELRPKLADRNKRLAAAFEKHDVLCAEIDTLSARVAELEGMVPRWVPVAQKIALDIQGWLPIDDQKCGDSERQWLMVPPIPLPGAEE